MKKIFIVIFSSLLCLITVACRHTIDFSQYPTVSYASDINPIIIANCTQSDCHGSVERRKFELLSYDDVMKHCGIVSGDPYKSKLYTIIKSFNKDNRMPIDPYPQLTDDQIKLIYLWIGQGAKNN